MRMLLDAPHVGFVLAAYGVSALVLLCLVVGHILRSHHMAQRLAELEASQTPRRRKSEGPAK